ncbi:MAG: phosphotransferase [Sphingomonadales bacterium]|nr:phosphotransferase [Sphingomonadales bacterium]
MSAIAAPTTLDHALDPRWLEAVLAPDSGGAPVTAVETVEIIRTMATKVRFRVTFAGHEAPRSYCLKAFLDVDEAVARGGGGLTTVREADFYALIAPHVAVRVPQCVASVIDREGQQGLIIMRDLVADGARFCSALEAFDTNDCAGSLEQIARLHAGQGLLAAAPWITPRLSNFVERPSVPVPLLQQLLDGPRGEGLPVRVRDAARLAAALAALAERDKARPQFLVHGDSHAGNIYRTAEGPGLIDWQLLQRGGWALDIAYHIAAVLPVELAEREERALLDHYLGVMHGLGLQVPDRETAWAQYREAAIYGFYLWSMTRRVEPAITETFVQRLGAAVTRHESHALLGVD